jgi:hypothetical protein
LAAAAKLPLATTVVKAVMLVTRSMGPRSCRDHADRPI